MENEDFSPEQFDSDFNLEDDYRPTPLCSNGNYHGNTTDIFFGDSGLLGFKVTLEGNEGMMSDGESPVDGSTHVCRVWLPSDADKDIPATNGRGTKFQTKVNMLANFAKAMQLNMNTMSDIREAVDNGDWIGLPVQVTLSISEYPKSSGVYNNQVERMIRVTEEIR